MVNCLAIKAKVALREVENLGESDNFNKDILIVMASPLVARMFYSITCFTRPMGTWMSEESIGVERIVKGDITC